MSIGRIKDKNKKINTLYHLTKESILVVFPYCPQNELAAKRFLSKFHQFTNQKFQMTIKWITKKVKSLLLLKDKKPYPACQIYKGMFGCDETYIAETIRNVDIRGNDHDDIRKGRI